MIIITIYLALLYHMFLLILYDILLTKYLFLVYLILNIRCRVNHAKEIEISNMEKYLLNIQFKGVDTPKMVSSASAL